MQIIFAKPMIDRLYNLKYYLLFGAFALWMVFFDSNNLFYRISVSREISEYEQAKKMHLESISDLRDRRVELFGNLRNLEKFAREKYLMKKDDEDLFIIEEVAPPKK